MNRHFVVIVGITLTIVTHATAQVTNTVVATLTYVGRSTETSSSVAYGSSLGSEVPAGLSLPLNPNQVIFDNGAYWNPDIQPNGVVWASWPQYSPIIGPYQARHFQATFTLPGGLNNVVGLTLFSPYYTAAGNLIPIDDNAYFYLNGTFIGAKGTSYGASNAPLPVPGMDVHETNGWHQDGSFGSSPVALLHAGINVLDIVQEDTYGGGGTGPLNVMLLNVVPEPTTVSLVFGAIPLLFFPLALRSLRQRP
jgi:hypothetical protein